MSDGKLPLIILPGWSGNEVIWQHQSNHLSDMVHPKVITITEPVLHIDKMVDMVLSMVSGPFHLVGHSLGGWLAQHIAIKAPDRVKKMVLLGTWTGTLTQDFKLLMEKNLERIQSGEAEQLMDELRAANFSPTRKNDLALFELMKKSQDEFPVDGLINQLNVILNGGDTIHLLDKIESETLVIHGADDNFFNYDDTKLWAAKIKHSAISVIEECGHMMSIEQPQAVTALIRLWLTIK